MKQFLFAVAAVALCASAGPGEEAVVVAPPVTATPVFIGSTGTPAVQYGPTTTAAPRRGLFGRLRNRGGSTSMTSSGATMPSSGPVYAPGMIVAPPSGPVYTPGTTAPAPMPTIVPTPMPMPGVTPTGGAMTPPTVPGGVILAGGRVVDTNTVTTIGYGEAMPPMMPVMMPAMMPMMPAMAPATMPSTPARRGLFGRLRNR